MKERHPILPLPIKLDSTSNGEFAPVPLDAVARAGARRARARRSTTAARRRRPVAARLPGLARSARRRRWRAFDRAFAAAGRRGGRYVLPAEAPFELAAAEAAIGGDDFIFDVQLHHVNPKGAVAPARRARSAFRSMPNSNCGKADHIECFSSGALLKDVFLDSDTAMGVLSHVPGGADDQPARLRGRRRHARGRQRARRHRAAAAARPLHADARRRDRRHGRAGRRASRWRRSRPTPSSARADGAAGFFLDDDRYGTPFIERARKLGVRRIAVHKGLPFGPRGYEYSTARDIGPAARRHPDMTFLVYHAGFDTAREGRARTTRRAKAGVDVLVRSMQEAGNPRNVYAELGSTWRFVMRDPDQAAHLLGKLLKTFGEDRVLWGTDSIWYGSPQDQIQAFRAFQISTELQERYGYPALTPALKRKVFGLNAAAGLRPRSPTRCAASSATTACSRRKAEYLNDPQPSFATYGPRNRGRVPRVPALARRRALTAAGCG